MPSRVIKSFHYDPGRQELHITFQSGHRYVYSAVPPAKVQDLKAAYSRGGYFQREIRDHFAYRRAD
ncbi:MAG: KTSC domain-containing protein [Pseudomonadota bacterium]|nr:KTSC domain-containing protein [Pseudomonadota bacterium]